MIQLLLASHGSMASGMKKAITILLGESKCLTVIDAYIDETNITETFKNYFDSTPSDTEVIMLSDLYGGSVNQIMYRYLERPNTKLIAGINLALLLEITAMVENNQELTDAKLTEVVEESRKAMQFVTLDLKKTETDEFF